MAKKGSNVKKEKDRRCYNCLSILEIKWDVQGEALRVWCPKCGDKLKSLKEEI